MLKRDARIGTKVIRTMGCRLTGTIIPIVLKEQWTDGTYRYPENERERRLTVGVLWSHGTRGLENVKYLEKL